MITENLTIGKNDYEVRLEDLNQIDLKFYPENPRVYSILNIDSAEPSQDDIEDYMCSQDHVKQLKESIKSNGGLIDPIIVRDRDFVVLEGNSRLAAYRILTGKTQFNGEKLSVKYYLLILVILRYLLYLGSTTLLEEKIGTLLNRQITFIVDCNRQNFRLSIWLKN